MKLKTYREKRHFDKSPEPKAISKSSDKCPIFCVQKHAASHLHYDFRLECKGVLLSWAVPKGPSIKSNQKRLAIHVEDHPYDYRDFEGTIPAGNYGAGTVMVWDEGTYMVSGANSFAEVERKISEGYKKGHIDFDLNGKKLKGGFVLIKMEDSDKEWLLIKKKDQYANSIQDITKNDLSAKTQRTLDEITLGRKPKVITKKKSLSPIIVERHFNDQEHGEAAPEIKNNKSQKAKANPKNSTTSHTEKIYWPELDLTKGDLLNYYQEISSYILPYLKNRPVMLHRYPNGVDGEDFYQKDTTALHLPESMKTAIIQHEDKPLRYVIVENAASLEYVVNLGSIELHTFNSTVSDLSHPDYLVVDLDPEAISFDKVVEAAQVFHQILEKIGVSSLCKTSGKRGLHIYIPLKKKYTFEQGRQFGELLAVLVHQKLPKTTSLERKPANRQKKVYLDVHQNGEKQTVVAPYSVRGNSFAGVSTPLKWSEVKKGLDPSKFNLKTVPARLKKWGDLFSPILSKGIDLKKSLNKLQSELYVTKEN
jgi:DNA ligase D-like protein (predicted polymerase)/DNA ligase D-like protein (predicted 3'-phosphoesterase)